MINELRQLDETLKDIESLLYKVCETDDVSILTREKLEAKIADFLRPQIIEEEEKAQEKAMSQRCASDKAQQTSITAFGLKALFSP